MYVEPAKDPDCRMTVIALRNLYSQGLITLDQLRARLPEGTFFVSAEEVQNPLTRELPSIAGKGYPMADPEILATAQAVTPENLYFAGQISLQEYQAMKTWHETVGQMLSDPREAQRRALELAQYKLELREYEKRQRSSRLLVEKDKQVQERKSLPEDWNVTDSKRVGDQERWKVNDLLTQYFEEGYLTKDEFEARMTSVVAAKTKTELKGVFSDLPELEAKPVLMVSSEGGGQLQKPKQHWSVYAVLAGAILNVILGIIMGITGHPWDVNIATSAFAFAAAGIIWKRK